MKILITGCAGFIGMHLTVRLLELGYDILGVDNLNDYYSVDLKKSRLANLKNQNFSFEKVDLNDHHKLEKVFKKFSPQLVIHFAAQAGVRYSIENPRAYFESNLLGFGNIIDACRKHKVMNFIYASSSSVYGKNEKIPYSVSDKVDNPISLYAATKKSNELIAHSYSHLYSMRTVGLRFFTVYGPWGRPDMAPWLFTDAIIKNRPISVYNNGNMMRDFTYISDVIDMIDSLVSVTTKKISQTNDTNLSGIEDLTKIYNVGGSEPIKLMDFISCIEERLGLVAKKNFLPMQDGDVLKTYADISETQRDFNYSPRIKLQKGVDEWVSWYLSFCK